MSESIGVIKADMPETDLNLTVDTLRKELADAIAKTESLEAQISQSKVLISAVIKNLEQFIEESVRNNPRHSGTITDACGSLRGLL